MATESQRLRRLLDLQGKLKAVHEMRHADYTAKAVAAGKEAAELFSEMGNPESLSHIFPDLYVRAVRTALAREHQFKEKARQEAVTVATQTARANMVADAWRSARQREERKEQEKEILEAVERQFHAGMARRQD